MGEMTGRTRAFQIFGPALLLPFAASTGCVSASSPSGPSIVEISRVTTLAAAQVKRCYRQPRVASVGRQIVTRLLVRYAPDGSLAATPAVLSQAGVTPANEVYASRMAQAAIQSVLTCAPLRLPAELYENGWAEFELTFSPRALA